MTEQEAMEIIMQVAYDGEFPLNSNEAFGIACKCIEKQIAKEVSTMKYRNDYDWTCNNCDTTFEYIRYTTDKPKYCPNCGQALKWE